MATEFKTIHRESIAAQATRARLWLAEQEARPISETVRTLDAAKKSGHELANYTFDALRLARMIKEERYISAADIAEIKTSILETRDKVNELSELLNDALASLKNPAIIEAAPNA